VQALEVVRWHKYECVHCGPFRIEHTGPPLTSCPLCTRRGEVPLRPLELVRVLGAARPRHGGFLATLREIEAEAERADMTDLDECSRIRRRLLALADRIGVER
jgi:hypothetical protein